jgi:integrase
LLHARIQPALGALPVEDIRNGVLKTFFAAQSKEVKPPTLQAMFNLIKQIVESAVDAEGERLYPQSFNLDFIDIPRVKPADQDAPVATREGIQQAISRAKDVEKALYALLAGSGLRISEALSLMVGVDDGASNFWDFTGRTIVIRKSKTAAGIRQVDLAPELNAFLVKLLCKKLWQSTVDSTRPIFSRRLQSAYEKLEATGILDGFHSFRRFRLTHLDGAGVPRGLVKFWAGHSAKDVTERYIRAGEGIAERKAWAAKAGLGFELEAA